ncbi:MAG: mechanosensitive ion channel [Alistipes sp.]|nr:mechanosensitive ion channel [Alistipes sp.]
MNRLSEIYRDWITGILLDSGCSEATATAINRWVALLIIILLAYLIDFIVRQGVVRVGQNIVARTRSKWDDRLFDRKLIRRLCSLVKPVVIYVLLPMAFSATDGSGDTLYQLLTKVAEIYLVYASARFANALLAVSFEFAEHKPSWHGKPIKGLLQTGQVVVIIIAVILIAAIIIDKSPVLLLTGLGASAAVLSFIFKDTILGLVAGVQLSANDMLKVGDWIEMPSRGIDGMVEEVALTTIKIRGWNNTTQTLPPYLLISEPFDNWQAMRDRGGRRIKRSLNIDMTTISFVSDELVERLRSNPTTAKLIEEVAPISDTMAEPTNLDLFMRYSERYIRNHPKVHKEMLIIVRQLQPSEWGLPVEIYCFSKAVDWIPHEQLQSELISHIVALIPLFDLGIYQAPTALAHSKRES